jgi:hypothetical protein
MYLLSLTDECTFEGTASAVTLIGSMTRRYSRLGDFNSSLEEFQPLLHSVIRGNGCYYHSRGGRKFPIHALPLDSLCEWANATHLHLATPRGTAPRNKGEFFLTQHEGKVVLIEVITGFGERGFPTSGQGRRAAGADQSDTCSHSTSRVGSAVELYLYDNRLE